MKKTLSLILSLVLLLASFSVSASGNTFYSDGLSGQIIGVCELEKIVDEQAIDGDQYFVLTIDTNSTIIFDTPLDMLSVSEPEKGGELYFEFYNGEFVSGDVCTVKYISGYREDSEDYYSFDVDLENEVKYIKENAEVRFNKPGRYLLTARLGFKDGYDRMSGLMEKTYGGDTYYALPSVTLNITVKSETVSESVESVERYDESIFSVSGITNYDESRVVMGDNIVAVCSSPVVIEAKTDLNHMEIVKLENINGEWVEARYFDGFAINYGDTSKNWYAAEGFENVDVDFYEFTGTEADFSDEAMSVKKGKKVSLSEKGMYLVWANGANGSTTGLTFEIGDAIAAYTDSKVLVDGKQVKFEAYNINDNNYFKLRDIAYALTNYGEGANVFNVKWDEERNMINLVSGFKYDAVGGELKEGDGKNKNYNLSSSALIKDGKNVSLTAYNINDNNYFKLRDLGKLFDFNVAWDGTNNCILIETSTSYME